VNFVIAGLNIVEIGQLALVPLMFQSGYLTVTEREKKGGTHSFILKNLKQ
jgi:hypothetical protein